MKGSCGVVEICMGVDSGIDVGLGAMRKGKLFGDFHVQVSSVHVVQGVGVFGMFL